MFGDFSLPMERFCCFSFSVYRVHNFLPKPRSLKFSPSSFLNLPFANRRPRSPLFSTNVLLTSLKLTEILLAVSPSFLHPHKFIFALLYRAEYHFYKSNPLALLAEIRNMI
jgi:hypothetical protein